MVWGTWLPWTVWWRAVAVVVVVVLTRHCCRVWWFKGKAAAQAKTMQVQGLVPGKDFNPGMVSLWSAGL